MSDTKKKPFKDSDAALQNKAASAISASIAKPNIFHYHDYVQYLNDWIKYQKKNQKGFSLRKVAAAAGISTGYLPMVLSGKRPLSIEALNKLLPSLNFSQSEKQFFENIHSLGITASQDERMECLRRMKRYSAYREHNPNESEVYRYLTKWYYITIREMSADPEFKLDAEWIQSRLRIHVPLGEIKEAIKFLVENKYIVISGTNFKIY